MYNPCHKIGIIQPDEPPKGSLHRCVLVSRGVTVSAQWAISVAKRLSSVTVYSGVLYCCIGLWRGTMGGLPFSGARLEENN